MPGRVKQLARKIDSRARMPRTSHKTAAAPKPEPAPAPAPEPKTESTPEPTTESTPEPTTEPTPETTSEPKTETEPDEPSEEDETTEEYDNPRTTMADTVVEGSFASKETPRVTSVMADGIAFIRELAEKLVEETKIADKAPIIILAIRLAEWAESRLRAFTGTEKKKMVLNLLLWAVENQEDVLFNILGENEDELYRLVRDVVPSVLDVVCAATKGELKLNHIVDVANGCFGWCFGKKKA